MLSAEDLNAHYTAISTDNSYISPLSRSGPVSSKNYFDEVIVWKALTNLKKTATGPDDIPYWFLKLGADSLYKPITAMLNESVSCTTVPLQWKKANIMPIPKVTNPTTASDFRPISITSVLARITEKLLIKFHLNPLIESGSDYKDQFAFRPTASTSAAQMAILNTVTDILENQQYARVLALDFSKAFDTVRHAELFRKLGLLNIPLEVFNWLIVFLHIISNQLPSMEQHPPSNTSTLE